MGSSCGFLFKLAVKRRSDYRCREPGANRFTGGINTQKDEFAEKGQP